MRACVHTYVRAYRVFKKDQDPGFTLEDDVFMLTISIILFLLFIKY